jgi:hypothetical protein
MTETGPTPESCRFRITANPAWQVTIEHVTYQSPCEYTITNGLPSPEKPCAWVVQLFIDDVGVMNWDENYGGGQCVEPLVECISGDCP